MKKRVLRWVVLSVMLLSVLFMGTYDVEAASMSVSASSTTITVGQSVTVNATVSGSNIGAATFNFSGAVSGNNSVNGGNPPGVGALSASKSFTPSSPGTYTVSVSANVGVYEASTDENGTVTYSTGRTTASGSVTITVKEAATPTPVQTPTSTPTKTPVPSKTPTASKTPAPTKSPEVTPSTSPSDTVTPTETAEEKVAGIMKVLNGENWYIQEKIPEDIFADGFEKNHIEIENEKIETLSSEKFAIKYVYALDGEGQNGRLCLYSEQKNEFANSVDYLQGTSKYCIVDSGSAAEVPEGYEERELVLDGKTINAYEDTFRSDFWLVLVDLGEDRYAWYSYDSREDTLQRFEERYVVPEGIEEPVPSEIAADENNTVDESDTDTDGNNRIFNLLCIALLITTVLGGFVFTSIQIIKKKNNGHKSVVKTVISEPDILDTYDDSYSYDGDTGTDYEDQYESSSYGEEMVEKQEPVEDFNNYSYDNWDTVYKRENLTQPKFTATYKYDSESELSETDHDSYGKSDEPYLIDDFEDFTY